MKTQPFTCYLICLTGTACLPGPLPEPVADTTVTDVMSEWNKGQEGYAGREERSGTQKEECVDVTQPAHFTDEKTEFPRE